LELWRSELLEKLRREIDLFVEKHPRSRISQFESEKHLPGGSSRGTSYFDPFPFFVDHGEGHYLHDVDGNRYLDFMINATSLITGHADPLVVKELSAQVRKGVSFSHPTDAQVRLAGLLCERIPSVESVRFVNSGTEATLNAIRVARAFSGKQKIAKFEGGYHGSNEYVSVSVNTPREKLDPGGPKAIPEFPGMSQAILDDVLVLPYNDLKVCQENLLRYRNELSCVIMEPVVSNFGYAPAKLEFLRGIRDLTEELGILLIYDEVQSFRVAPGGAQELFGVVPDLTTLGKVIGGGMPVGAFGGRADVMALYDPTGAGPVIGHAGTFNANPMTMVAGEAVIQQLTPKVYARLGRLGGILRSKLEAIFGEFNVEVQVTGVESLFGIHFTSEEVVDNRSMLRGDTDMKKLLFMGLLNEGVLTQAKAAGSLSTLTTETEVDRLVSATRSVVDRIKG
jgi:glutamate-1-semialdehyde 2,1-aminomutase